MLLERLSTIAMRAPGDSERTMSAAISAERIVPLRPAEMSTASTSSPPARIDLKVDANSSGDGCEVRGRSASDATWAGNPGSCRWSSESTRSPTVTTSGTVAMPRRSRSGPPTLLAESVTTRTAISDLHS
jgi:hypothetical protein